jgi:hypothetical protein
MATKSLIKDANRYSNVLSNALARTCLDIMTASWDAKAEGRRCFFALLALDACAIDSIIRRRSCFSMLIGLKMGSLHLATEVWPLASLERAQN